MIAGIVILLLMAAFIGITVWAWSGRRRSDFEEAANLPLHDEAPPHPRSARPLPKGRGDKTPSPLRGEGRGEGKP